MMAAAAVDPAVARHDAQAIAEARVAVGEMLQIAGTPQEKALAERDRQIVERVAQLVAHRAEAMRRLSGGSMTGGTGGGAIGSGSMGGGGNPIGGAAGGDGQQQLLDATKQMQETQMSFNLQYLQLQSQMRRENRSYTAISNIMKLKHDTVRNSISNIR